MRVLLVGGYGVFGARLARLLVVDGHDVCIAGRSLADARHLAEELGCRAARFDRTGTLDGIAGHDVVIDAAGPFHAYGTDRYRLAAAAIAEGSHYLDLSENAGFCAGISSLDSAARAAGVCVLSGLSSVPALSSAAICALAGSDRVSVIDTAILPGNRAPRGLSVMQSILEQAGRPMRMWRGGKWVRVWGWSNPRMYELPGRVCRQGWCIGVPDLLLFPARFGAETVMFRAGLELGVMRYGLAAFGVLRRIVPFPVTRWLVRVFKAAADLLAPFGSGRGGMSVSVAVAGEWRGWTLLAEDGDGPFIPGVAARALLRRRKVPVGAAPAVGIITLMEAEEAMSDLRVRTERRAWRTEGIFRQVMGAEFDALPCEVKETHLTADTSHWIGRGTVVRGRGLWALVLCALFRFPPDSADTGVAVTKTVTPRGETWVRRFGRRAFRSHLSAGPDGMVERFGPFSFLLALRVENGELHYPVKSGRIGPIPLPRFMLPVSVAREFELDGAFHFDVRLLAPITGTLIVHYSGWLGRAPFDDPSVPPMGGDGVQSRNAEAGP